MFKLLEIQLFCLLVVSGNLLNAQTTYESLRAGDAAYNRSNYSKAEPHYRRVTEKEPANWNAAYNLGNTLYQQGKYEEAAPIFEKSAGSAPDKRAKADALYNAGNAWLKQNKFGDAIKAYESSLRLRPGDPDTKMNLQMAKKKNKQEEERKKQQQQQQNQNQDQQQNEGQGENKPQDQQPKDDPQQQDKQQQPNPPQQPSKPNQPQQNDPQRLKQEEAKRLLETTIGPEDRKNARKYRSGQKNKAPQAGKKDW